MVQSLQRAKDGDMLPSIEEVALIVVERSTNAVPVS
jgi:hypothetical protein